MQLWVVIEQVLQKDYLLSVTDEEKLPSNDTKVGQKVFLERRSELNEDGDDLVTLENVDNPDNCHNQDQFSDYHHQENHQA